MSAPKSVLEAALLAEAPKQWERFQQNVQKREKGKPKWRREIDKVADAREILRQRDPELIRITTNLDRKTGTPVGCLHCPKCGEPDMHNTMNGKAWCIKCNVALASKASTGPSESIRVKALPRTKRLDVTFRGIDE